MYFLQKLVFATLRHIYFFTFAFLTIYISLGMQYVYANSMAVTISSGNVTGMYNLFAQKLCDSLNQKDITCKIILSNGSHNNIKNIENDVADITILQKNIFTLYNQSYPEAPLYLISKLFDEAVTIVTKTTSQISSPADFKNRSIGVNSLNILNTDFLQELLSHYNITTSDLQSIKRIPLTGLTENLCEDEVEVLLLNIAHPNIPIYEINNMCEVKIIPLEQKLIDKLIDYNHDYYKYSIPSFFYNTLHDIDTVAMSALLVAKNPINDHIKNEIIANIPKILEDLKHI